MCQRSRVFYVLYSLCSISPETSDVQHIPINQIHFVAADPRCPTIFSLVARGRDNKFLCHVFQCNSFKQCDRITRTVSEAFRIAYERWLHVEENQRRLEERRAREMDMGGIGKMLRRLKLCKTLIPD